MNYEDFCTPDEVETFKRVKRRQMRLARVARAAAVNVLRSYNIAAEISGQGKEFVRTGHGLYRLAMAHNSDNQTEEREHAYLGATPVVMGDSGEMMEFFQTHGIYGALTSASALAAFHREIRRLLDDRPTSIRAMLDGEL